MQCRPPATWHRPDCGGHSCPLLLLEEPPLSQKSPSDTPWRARPRLPPVHSCSSARSLQMLFNKRKPRNSVCRGQVTSESSTSLTGMNTRVLCSSGQRRVHGLIEKILCTTTLLFLAPSVQQPGETMHLTWPLSPLLYYKSAKSAWQLAEGRQSKAKCSLSFCLVGTQTQYVSNCQLQVEIFILEFAA